MSGDDVIDLEGYAGFGLGEAAVFAPASGSLPHLSCECGIHARAPMRFLQGPASPGVHQVTDGTDVEITLRGPPSRKASGYRPGSS